MVNIKWHRSFKVTKKRIINEAEKNWSQFVFVLSWWVSEGKINLSKTRLFCYPSVALSSTWGRSRAMDSSRYCLLATMAILDYCLKIPSWSCRMMIGNCLGRRRRFAGSWSCAWVACDCASERRSCDESASIGDRNNYKVRLISNLQIIEIF